MFLANPAPPCADLRRFRIVSHAVTNDCHKAATGCEHVQCFLDVLAAYANSILAIGALGIAERRVHHNHGRPLHLAFAYNRVEH